MEHDDIVSENENYMNNYSQHVCEYVYDPNESNRSTIELSFQRPIYNYQMHNSSRRRKPQTIMKKEEEIKTKHFEEIKPKYPVSRIQRIMKTLENKKNIKKEVLLMLTKGVELFISDVTNRAAKLTKKEKRKVIKMNDIVEVLLNDEIFDFCIDLLPYSNPKHCDS